MIKKLIKILIEKHLGKSFDTRKSKTYYKSKKPKGFRGFVKKLFD